jgi:hypothetical protein
MTRAEEVQRKSSDSTVGLFLFNFFLLPNPNSSRPDHFLRVTLLPKKVQFEETMKHHKADTGTVNAPVNGGVLT